MLKEIRKRERENGKSEKDVNALETLQNIAKLCGIYQIMKEKFT